MIQVVAYVIDGVEYWIATNRFDLFAEQIATDYKLRWDIESFFAWWERHLNVYHLIARSEHGLMVQVLVGLITYLLLAIYCHKQHQEKVSITYHARRTWFDEASSKEALSFRESP
jgi:IS4 transposase